MTSCLSKAVTSLGVDAIEAVTSSSGVGDPVDDVEDEEGDGEETARDLVNASRPEDADCAPVRQLWHGVALPAERERYFHIHRRQ